MIHGTTNIKSIHGTTNIKSIRMGCAAESPGCRFLPFRVDIVSSSSGVQMSKKSFLDITTLVICVWKAYGGNIKSEFVLEKLYARLRSGIHLAQE